MNVDCEMLVSMFGTKPIQTKPNHHRTEPNQTKPNSIGTKPQPQHNHTRLALV